MTPTIESTLGGGVTYIVLKGDWDATQPQRERRHLIEAVASLRVDGDAIIDVRDAALDSWGETIIEGLVARLGGMVAVIAPSDGTVLRLRLARWWWAAVVSDERAANVHIGTV